jgi:hypothetical protein
MLSLTDMDPAAWQLAMTVPLGKVPKTERFAGSPAHDNQ